MQLTDHYIIMLTIITCKKLLSGAVTLNKVQIGYHKTV